METSPSATQTGRPRISVLIPVTSHGVIAACVEELAAQKGVKSGEFDVWIADAEPTRDWTSAVEAALRRRGLSLPWNRVTSEGRGRAAALNAMLGRAAGDIVLFLADDFVPDCRLVVRHLHFHERHPEPQRAAVGPGLFPALSRRSEFVRWLEDSGSVFGVPFTDPNLVLPHHFFYLGNTSVKRSLLDRAGHFDERFPFDAWDDYEMGLRLCGEGYHAGYVPKAACVHQHHVTLRERMEQVRRGGRSAAIQDRFRDFTHPWHEPMRRAAATSRVERLRQMASALLRKLLNPGDEACRAAYYRIRLEWAFVAGYEEECAQAPGRGIVAATPI